MQIAVLFGGIALVLAGWLFFRLPGVQFWVFTPIWRANRYLSPLGVTLWVGGLLASLTGVAMLFVPSLLSG